MAVRTTGMEEKAGCSCPMRQKIRDILYWERPIHSAVLLFVLLVSQLAFVCFSAIKIFAYLGLLTLAVVNGYRLYAIYIAKDKENVIMDYIDRDVTISSERVSDLSKRMTEHFNHGVVKARDLFLFTHLGRTFQFAAILHLLTIVGAHVNFLTLSIVATVFVFILPKVYDRYKTEIDGVCKKVKVQGDKLVSQISTQLDKLPFVGHRKQKEQ